MEEYEELIEKEYVERMKPLKDVMVAILDKIDEVVGNNQTAIEEYKEDDSIIEESDEEDYEEDDESEDENS